MSDINTNEDGEIIETASEIASPTKFARSKRLVLDAAGVSQDEWIGAKGFSYTVLSEKFTLAVMFEDLPEDVVSALAAFGGLTLAGNVTNTVRNGKAKGTGALESAALNEWLDNLRAGNWTTDRGEIEASMTTLATAYTRAQAKAGKVLNIAEVEAKLKAASKEIRANVRKDVKVKAELAEMAAAAAAARALAAAPDVGIIEL